MVRAININKKLANKFYLFSIGLYLAVASVFLFLYLLQTIFGFNQLLAIFIGYFITVIWRAFYDQLTIYKLTIKQINFKNNLILALIAAFILAILYYFVKPLLGDWSVPFTVIISMQIIAKIRKFLWPNTASKLPELLRLYSQKIQFYTYGLYGFFIAIALITYEFIILFGRTHFYLAFAVGVLLGLCFEQLYDLMVVYKTKITKAMIVATMMIAIIFSILCSALVFMLMQEVGLSGKIATIVGIITLKLVQPLLLNLLLKE